MVLLTSLAATLRATSAQSVFNIVGDYNELITCHAISLHILVFLPDFG